MNKAKVVLDTSIIFQAYEYKSNIFEMLKDRLGNVAFLIPLAVVEEVERISRNRGKRGLKAKTALILLKHYEEDIDVVPSQRNADNAVIEVAKAMNASIATADKALAKRGRKEGLKVFLISSGKLVE